MHAATIGEWTDVLEDACMKDEPIPAMYMELSKLADDWQKIENWMQ